MSQRRNIKATQRDPDILTYPQRSGGLHAALRLLRTELRPSYNSGAEAEPLPMCLYIENRAFPEITEVRCGHKHRALIQED